MTLRQIGAALALCILAASAFSAPRSAAARLEFKRHNPCPANGLRRGACPGYVIDHVRPLCAGGADLPGNMQWQTRQAALEKDRHEWRLCRRIRNPDKIEGV